MLVDWICPFKKETYRHFCHLRKSLSLCLRVAKEDNVILLLLISYPMNSVLFIARGKKGEEKKGKRHLIHLFTFDRLLLPSLFFIIYLFIFYVFHIFSPSCDFHFNHFHLNNFSFFTDIYYQ